MIFQSFRTQSFVLGGSVYRGHWGGWGHPPYATCFGRQCRDSEVLISRSSQHCNFGEPGACRAHRWAIIMHHTFRRWLCAQRRAGNIEYLDASHECRALQVGGGSAGRHRHYSGPGTVGLRSLSVLALVSTGTACLVLFTA